MANSGDSGCSAALIAAGAAAVFAMAPHLALQAVSGDSGTVAAIASTGFLAVSFLAPFLPKVGVVLGFQWTIYALWLVGYFDVVGSWITTMTTWSDPNAGFDGFFLSLLLLVPLLIAMVVVFLAVPGTIGIAGGLFVNLPASTARRAWHANPFPLWSSYTSTTPLPDLEDDHTQAGDTAHPTGSSASTSTSDHFRASGSGEFRVTRWSAPHRRVADSSLTRRQCLLNGSAIAYLALAPLSLVLMFASDLPTSRKAVAYAALFLAALGLAAVQLWIARSASRDITTWSIDRDEYFDIHVRSVGLANQWATRVHPDDLRDGRALVASLLDQSEKHMDDAQRLTQRAERESLDAGPGWDPPSRRELIDTRAALLRVQDGVGDAADAATNYRQDQAARALAADERQKQQRMQDDTTILTAATEVYAAAYVAAWENLPEDGAGGLPRPSLTPWNGSFPEGLPPADLTAELARIVQRADEDFTHAARSPGSSPTLDRAVVRLFDASRLLQRTAALTQAASARLRLMDRTEHSHAGVDDMVVNDLIRHIRARAEAENRMDGPAA